ncbi:MAG: hypothetical protein ACRD12_14100 [Acidimicrobiales bacterium]
MNDVSPQEELAEQEEKKDDEVLEREGFEQELMQEGESEVGERVEGVEDAS